MVIYVYRAHTLRRSGIDDVTHFERKKAAHISNNFVYTAYHIAGIAGLHRGTVYLQ